jgi:hypothetical protein
LHPEGVYDDPKGGVLREVLYRRLRNHFQFENQLSVFSEIHHNTKFSINQYGSQRNPAFIHFCNIFRTSTIDASAGHNGTGLVGGIKNEANQWNTEGHQRRFIPVDIQRLELFSRLYDDPGTPAGQARLPALHSQQLLSVLEKLAVSPSRLCDIKKRYMATKM